MDSSKNEDIEDIILDEEINAETKNDERFDNDFCWFIDPLDGTISYIKNQDTYGVFIGLTHKLKPVLGVTYQPNLGELCYATKSNGAYIEKNNQKQILTVNKNTEIHTLTSYFRNDPELNKLLNKINPKTTTPMPSSLKTIEVAKGNYNLSICPRESYMNLWDFCAPQIILEEAGGKITDLCGNLIDYAGCIINKKGALASNGIIHENIIYKLKN